MSPMPNTCMALQTRLTSSKFIAGIFVILTFQIHVLTCSAPCRESGFGLTMERKKEKERKKNPPNLNSNSRIIFYCETCFGRVSRRITWKGGGKRNPLLSWIMRPWIHGGCMHHQGRGPVISARNIGKTGRQRSWAEFKVKKSIYHFVFQTKFGIFL